MGRVLVVGAGISGAACASALRSAGIEVDVRERARAVGGRMASPSLHGRRVDIGAAYFTSKEPEFQAVVDDWLARGLIRPWTDTMTVFGADGRTTTSGPQRLAAPDGLRSLARDLHGAVTLEAQLTELPDGYDATVLAMPDPQAARLAPDLVDWVDYEPVIAVVAGFAERTWDVDAAFVNDHADLTLIADDGRRRGDDAPVLVAHTTAQRARQHLDAPEDAIASVVDAISELLDIVAEPEWTHAHRWTFAKPAETHGDLPFALAGDLGVCGDSWCPSGAPRVEAAWLSGHRLGTDLAQRLGSGT